MTNSNRMPVSNGPWDRGALDRRLEVMIEHPRGGHHGTSKHDVPVVASSESES